MSIKSIVLGIDPGSSASDPGAIAYLDVHCKVFTKQYSVKSWENTLGAFDNINAVTHCKPVLVFIEKVTPHINKNKTALTWKAMQSLLKNVGAWKAMLELCGLEYQEVAPITWQTKILPQEYRRQRKKPGQPEIKQKAAKYLYLDYARLIFPEADMKRQKDSGRAAALLIALYGLMQISMKDYFDFMKRKQ